MGQFERLPYFTSLGSSAEGYLRALGGLFYGETFIPRAWVERRLCAEFELIASAHDPARYDQAWFVLRRR